jgi:N-acetylglucosaminyl-diphospho-decaprenol L-rhamnosyltransferase
MAGPVMPEQRPRPPTGVTSGLSTTGERLGVLVIVVNFRTPTLTIDCLHSLVDEVASVPGSRVVVVDNCSGDDSLPKIQAAIDQHLWSAWVTLIAHPVNGGFAAGNNAGLEAMPGAWKYVLLLNSDTIMHEGCLRMCVQALDADATIGAFSCRILNADGTIQNVTRRFPSPLRTLVMGLNLHAKLPSLFEWADVEDNHWDRLNMRRAVDWVGGAFMMLPAAWVMKHGLLDERFFFYGEDIEICHRVWRTGHRVVYDPAATTTHLGGSSSDPSRMAAQARSIHVWRGKYMTLRLCHGRLAETLIRGFDIALHTARYAAAKALGRGGPQRAGHLREVLKVISGRLWEASPTVKRSAS